MKKRIIAFLIGFVVFFNAVIFSYKRAEAVVGEEAIVEQVIRHIFFSTYFREATSSAQEAAGDVTFSESEEKDFIDYVKEKCPDVVSDLAGIINPFGTTGGVVKSVRNGVQTESFSIPTAELITLFGVFQSYLDDTGNYDAASNTYSRITGSSDSEYQTGIYNMDDIVAKAEQIITAHYGHTVSTGYYFITGRIGYAPYLSIVGDNNGRIYFCACTNGFAYNDTNNVPYTTCVWGDGSQTSSDYCPVGTVYANFKYDSSAPAGGLSDSGSVTYGPLTDSASKYWTDLESALQELDQTYGKDVTRHYADGSTSTDRETTVNVPFKAVKEVEDENGNITYQDLTAEELNELDGTEENIVFIPMSFSEIADRGIILDFDTVFEQPAADVVVPDAGTITNTTTGAVSITNSSDIAKAIAGTYAGALGDGKIKMDDFEIQRDLTTVFPFCLPFDIMRIIKTFVADEAVAPVISFDFSEYYPFNMVPAEYSSNLKFELDMSKFDVLIKIEKFFVIMSYVQFLIIKTRGNLIRG